MTLYLGAGHLFDLIAETNAKEIPQNDVTLSHKIAFFSILHLEFSKPNCTTRKRIFGLENAKKKKNEKFT